MKEQQLPPFQFSLRIAGQWAIPRTNFGWGGCDTLKGPLQATNWLVWFFDTFVMA